jgi:hypothetical protein
VLHGGEGASYELIVFSITMAIKKPGRPVGTTGRREKLADTQKDNIRHN